jgi:hypothetical protein
MKTQIIYFTGIMALLIAATVSVPAQEGGAALNATLNNTTMNNTTLKFAVPGAAINITAAENVSEENVSVENATVEDVTSETVPVSAIEAVAEDTAPLVAEASSQGGNVVNIGTGLESDRVFVVNGNAKAKNTFEVGIPIKPCRDVGQMVFVCDIV